MKALLILLTLSSIVAAQQHRKRSTIVDSVILANMDMALTYSYREVGLDFEELKALLHEAEAKGIRNKPGATAAEIRAKMDRAIQGLKPLPNKLSPPPAVPHRIPFMKLIEEHLDTNGVRRYRNYAFQQMLANGNVPGALVFAGHAMPSESELREHLQNDRWRNLRSRQMRDEQFMRREAAAAISNNQLTEVSGEPYEFRLPSLTTEASRVGADELSLQPLWILRSPYVQEHLKMSVAQVRQVDPLVKKWMAQIEDGQRFENIDWEFDFDPGQLFFDDEQDVPRARTRLNSDIWRILKSHEQRLRFTQLFIQRHVNSGDFREAAKVAGTKSSKTPRDVAMQIAADSLVLKTLRAVEFYKPEILKTMSESEYARHTHYRYLPRKVDSDKAPLKSELFARFGLGKTPSTKGNPRRNRE